MAISDGNNLLYEIDENGQRILVKSIESVHQVYLRFSNRTSHVVDIWWRDFNGNRRHYARIPPGDHKDLNSYLTHPWEFTGPSTKEHYVINNKIIFRAPTSIGGMMYRTNWNICIGMRSLRHTALLSIASLLPTEEAAAELDLPRMLAEELSEIVSNLLSPPPISEDT